MRKIAILGLLAVLVTVTASAMAGEPVVVGQVGVQYVWDGPMGTLSIASAEGLPFEARAINGQLVAQGVVGGPMMSIAVPNFGQRVDGTVLYVQVGTASFQVDDEDWDWH